jgi:hypothetical protein
MTCTGTFLFKCSDAKARRQSWGRIQASGCPLGVRPPFRNRSELGRRVATHVFDGEGRKDNAGPRDSGVRHHSSVARRATLMRSTRPPFSGAKELLRAPIRAPNVGVASPSRISGGVDVARPAGLEPAAPRLEVSCSIQLSYGRVDPNGTPNAAPLMPPPDRTLQGERWFFCRKSPVE